jgi:hypothetical protein
MGVWEYGSVFFFCVEVFLLNMNLNLVKTKTGKKTSMGVWEYGSVEMFFHTKYFFNSSMKPFIHACFE